MQSENVDTSQVDKTIFGFFFVFNKFYYQPCDRINKLYLSNFWLCAIFCFVFFFFFCCQISSQTNRRCCRRLPTARPPPPPPRQTRPQGLVMRAGVGEKNRNHLLLLLLLFVFMLTKLIACVCFVCSVGGSSTASGEMSKHRKNTKYSIFVVLFF